MSRQIYDQDTQLLIAVAENLKSTYLGKVESEWAESPFEWFLTKSSRQRGKIGEQLVSGWCAARGLDVVSVHDPGADRIINGHRVEIKFSTLWESGVYKFQQIRDQNYDFLICLGLSPFIAHCWVIPKRVLFGDSRPDGLSGQHLGKEGKDTSWLSFRADNPPKWLSQYGGRLSAALEIIRRFE